MTRGKLLSLMELDFMMLKKSNAGKVTLKTSFEAVSIKVSLIILKRLSNMPRSNIKQIGPVIEAENRNCSIMPDMINPLNISGEGVNIFITSRRNKKWRC